MVTTTRHPKHAVYDGQGARRQNCRDNATAVAETMLQQKTVFWVPRDTWAEWSTSSSSNRFGWIVQVVGQRSDANGTTVFMVRSLHRDEFHRHRDINETSQGKDISLWRIAGLKRDALMMSLSCAELGKLTEGGFWPCQALQNYTLKTQFSFKRTSERHGSLTAHGSIKVTQCRSQ